MNDNPFYLARIVTNEWQPPEDGPSAAKVDWKMVGAVGAVVLTLSLSYSPFIGQFLG